MAVVRVPRQEAAAGIWCGIRAMIRFNEDRAEQQREALKEQREADERHHAEAMQAIADQRRALEALIADLERQGAAFEELVRHTVPRPPGPAE